MHNNWEDAIKEFRTTSLVDIEPKLNEKEVYEVWKLGAIAILTFIDKKNKVSNKDILKKRLAKGELSIEEFRTLIDEL